MVQLFSAGSNPRRTGGRIAIIVLAALAVISAACHPHGHSRSSTLAEQGAVVTGPVFHGGGRFDYVTVIQQQDGQRFDYLVHLVGGAGGKGSAGKKLARRLKRAKRIAHHRCKVAQVVDLYQHRVGVRTNGRPQISYSMGIVCK